MKKAPSPLTALWLVFAIAMTVFAGSPKKPAEAQQVIPQAQQGSVATPERNGYVYPELCATEPERCWKPLDEWLKKNGSPLSGRDFYEVGRQYRLDPDFLIAITQAETNLGKVKQRGSECNVGSVGSYDATNTTFACDSARHGIELIAQTLNNDKLGKKVTIAQLSRKSEPYGPVYAESRNNWETNVLNTLSQLKGKQVNNQYQFRG